MEQVGGGKRISWVVLSVLLVTSAGFATQGETLRWRREYNQVVAGIDTLERLYGGAHLDRLGGMRPPTELVPAGMQLMLIFWADDEAEVFLNGFRVSETRLTPIQVEIPELYLRQQNLLRVHCWDTDRVESGFMAGLYLRDDRGGLRPILVSGERGWGAGEKPAQEIYYNHQQPDIPGARVIWGEKLFGEIWLEAGFGAEALRRAAQALSTAAPNLEMQERPMQVHQVVGRLVRLQQRREELSRALESQRLHSDPEGAYRGYVRTRLAFTLGQAAPLSEAQGITTSEQLHEWANTLPEHHKQLIFREKRTLKGTSAATPAKAFEGGERGLEDRRTDYRPPPERGQGGKGQGPGAGPGARRGAVAVKRGFEWDLLTLVIGLAFYIGVAGRQWWKVFGGKDWKP